MLLGMCLGSMVLWKCFLLEWLFSVVMGVCLMMCCDGFVFVVRYEFNVKNMKFRWLVYIIIVVLLLCDSDCMCCVFCSL